jgi:hypothetical protein
MYNGARYSSRKRRSAKGAQRGRNSLKRHAQRRLILEGTYQALQSSDPRERHVFVRIQSEPTHWQRMRTFVRDLMAYQREWVASIRTDDRMGGRGRMADGRIDRSIRIESGPVFHTIGTGEAATCVFPRVHRTPATRMKPPSRFFPMGDWTLVDVNPRSLARQKARARTRKVVEVVHHQTHDEARIDWNKGIKARRVRAQLEALKGLD